MLHSPTWRERYSQLLRADFPRVPPPGNAAIFRELAGLGRRLVAAHLLRSDVLSDSPATFPAPGDNVVAAGYPRYAPAEDWSKIRWSEIRDGDAGRVYINRGQYFAGVTPAVWEFRIGGTSPWTSG